MITKQTLIFHLRIIKNKRVWFGKSSSFELTLELVQCEDEKSNMLQTKHSFLPCKIRNAIHEIFATKANIIRVLNCYNIITHEKHGLSNHNHWVSKTKLYGILLVTFVFQNQYNQ